MELKKLLNKKKEVNRLDASGEKTKSNKELALQVSKLFTSMKELNEEIAVLKYKIAEFERNIKLLK